MTLPSVYRYDPERKCNLARRDGLTCIYGLFDPRTFELRYIGKSVNPANRLARHRSTCNGQRSYLNSWLRGLTISGMSVLMQDIDWVLTTPHEVWIAAERWHIAAAREAGIRLVNFTDGGDGKPGYHPTEEQRARMRAAQIGRHHSPETKAKMSASIRASMTPEVREKIRVNRGTVHITEEQKRKLSEARKGKTLSEEHKAKISAGVRRAFADPVVRERVVSAQRKIADARRGTSISDEMRQRISRTLTGRKLTPEHRAHVGAAHLGRKKPKQSATMKALWSDPDFRARQMKARQRPKP